VQLRAFAKPLVAVSAGLNATATFWTFVLMCFMTADVAGRYFFNRPLTGAPEIVKMSLILLLYFHMPYTLWIGRHIRSDLLANRMNPRGRRIVSIVNHLLGSVICVLICWSNWGPLLKALELGEYEGEGALHVPVAPFRLFLIIGAAMTAVLYLLKAIQELLETHVNGADAGTGN
jgi:TRAP-type C4-dicarboxylate transport system permease small subunit